MDSGLSPDAVVKGADLDGDGDPDEIHIRLEVAELNGGSPESLNPVTSYELGPGIAPGFWVFTPKYAGMSTENFESNKAQDLIRVPSPAIRVEQGDKVLITLENTHYMPHTLHLHGTDHGFVDVNGEGNDGVPITSELPLMPGQARTYELQAREAGTKFYHCHVQPHVHIMMGLQGLFVIEENRPDNWLQTMNVGAGHVRVPSVAVREEYDREYDLHYSDVDIELNQRIQSVNDPRLITESMHRDFDATESSSDYFALNGRSFPYTFRESLVLASAGEMIKLRVVNGGREGVALHTHGHTMTITHRDGVAAEPAARITRDVVWIATAQRLDLALSTTNDGLGSYGNGVWLFHDHGSKQTTSNGIGPGGHISAIVYDDYLGNNGWPETSGVSFDPYFTSAYYRKQLPVWAHYGKRWFTPGGDDRQFMLRLILFSMLAGIFLAALLARLGGRHNA
jgi:FtsP/CotA-like multicopper oxidase with cupredoxin domain